MQFMESFKAAVRVSTPLVCIRTFDAKSTTSGIIAALQESPTPIPMLLWDCVHGLVPMADTKLNQDTLNTILAGNEQAFTIPLPNCLALCENNAVSDAIIFISNAHLQWSNHGESESTVVQAIWNLRDSYKANGDMLILLAAPGSRLPGELTNDVLCLDEPLPTVAELQATVRNTYRFAKTVNTPDDPFVVKATEALIGLPSFAAEQAAAMSLTINRTDPKKLTGDLSLDDLWGRKRQIINQTPGLSIHAGKETLEDVGGNEAVKEFLRGIMEGNNPPSVILFTDEIEKGMAGAGTDMSGVKDELNGSILTWTQERQIEGMLLLGIPGVSKSLLAKATGGTYGKPVIIFDIPGMQSGIIGSSGERIRNAQAIVDATSGWTPTSGGKVLWLATCNGVASLKPELRRRFSLAQFFFDAPTREEKDLIWQIHRAKQKIDAKDTLPNDEGWTGAEIESCCKKAYRLRWTLEKAAQYIVPITKSAATQIEQTRSEASGKYLSASHPGVYMAHESTRVGSGQVTPPVFMQQVEGRRMKA